MPFLIKHKDRDRYITGTAAKASFDDNDPDGLVAIEFARIYATRAGAISALNYYSKIWDGATANLVVDKIKLDAMEIVECKVK